ncbi:hypothetical protein [Alteribacillus sp. HJP-4]
MTNSSIFYDMSINSMTPVAQGGTAGNNKLPTITFRSSEAFY